MVKFTHIPVKTQNIAKTPSTSLDYIVSYKSILQDTNLTLPYILNYYNSQKTLPNQVLRLLNSKKPIKFFFNMNLNLRLNKLLKTWPLHITPTPNFKPTPTKNLVQKVQISNVNKLWVFKRPQKLFNKRFLKHFKKVFRKLRQVRSFWFVKSLKKAKSRLERLKRFTKITLKRKKRFRFSFFKKYATFYYSGNHRWYNVKVKQNKKKLSFNLKTYRILNSRSYFSKLKTLTNVTDFKSIRLNSEVKKKRRSRAFFKKRKSWKARSHRYVYLRYFNTKKKIPLYRIGYSLFSYLKPQSLRFFQPNFFKINSNWNLTAFDYKYTEYAANKKISFKFFSRYLRFKSSQDRSYLLTNGNSIYLNLKYSDKLTIYNSIVLTKPILNFSHQNAYIINLFFKSFYTDSKPLNTQFFLNNKNLPLVYPLNSQQNYDKTNLKNVNTVYTRLTSKLKTYSIGKFNMKNFVLLPKSQNWVITKFNIELNNFIVFNHSKKFKFNNKKIILSSSAFKGKNHLLFSRIMRSFSIRNPFSTTHNLVSSRGYMPALPLIYYEDAPGFLLNYDVETLYNHAPCTSSSKLYNTSSSFLTPTTRNYKLFTFNMTKGDSYFELNNLLNPLITSSSIVNKSVRRISKNTSAGESVQNYGYFASTKHLNPLEDLNQFPFRKKLLKHNLTSIVSKIRKSSRKLFRPRRFKKQFRKYNYKVRKLFFKSKKIPKWTKSKFKSFLLKYNIVNTKTITNNPILYKKKYLFAAPVTVSRFSKSDSNIMWKATLKEFIAGHTTVNPTKHDIFDSTHHGNLTTIKQDLDKRLLKPEKVNFLHTLFTGFLNLNTFIYSNDLLLRLLTNRFFYKNFIFKLNTFTSNKSIIITIINSLARSSRNFFFNDRITKYRKSNLVPLTCFNFEIQRFVVQHVRGGLWLTVSTQTITTLLVRFVENVSGRKALLRFAPNAFKFLTIKDHARAIAWEPRIKSWQLLLGPKFFAAESLKLIGVMLRSRDPYFFSRWVVIVSARLDFFNHRKFFRLIRLLLKWYYSLFFNEFGLTGIKLKFKGKISVAGNSRKRSQFARAGITSNSKVANRVTSDINYIYTFTGAVAFQIWLYF